MITQRGPLILSDTSINIDPNSEELAEIAQMTANLGMAFGFDPVLAVIYKGDRSQFDIKGARVSVYTSGGRTFKTEL